MITVMGATGQVGNGIVTRLREAGEEVQALGRSEAKLSELREIEAETLAGDAGDAAFLTDAFQGADAIFTMLPHDPTVPDSMAKAEEFSESIVKAIHDSGVRFVVALSSIGADLPSGSGFIQSLYRWEQRLRILSGVDMLLLRPGYFFENFYPSLPFIKQEGIYGDSLAPDTSIPMIATRDIAYVAANALMTRDWQGVVMRELLGPRDLSLAEVTQILGEKMGRPTLPYVQFTDAEMVEALTKVGIAEDFASLSVETNRAMNEGLIRSQEGRTPENTTPTRFEDFAADLARAYKALP